MCILLPRMLRQCCVFTHTCDCLLLGTGDLKTLSICNISSQSCANICSVWELSLLDMKLLSCFQNQYPDLQSTVQPWLQTSQTNANMIKLVHSVRFPQATLERFSQWDISNQAWVNIRGDKILQMFKMSWRSEKQLAVRKCLHVASLCEGQLWYKATVCVQCLSK